ncbi:MAG: septum formation protein Maf [Candidatus Eremiobacteraeota bacterium]|nr:septum formation protein Maf [Candidatus Eremiobacteraeota bacterium]
MIRTSHPRVITTLVLASRSPRRRELLASLGVAVDVVPSLYRENDLPGTPPLEIARTHARGKAADVSARERGPGPVIAADTVVDLDGASLGKPRDAGDARTMLASLSGRPHLVHTAFAVADGSRLIEGDSTTEVRFHRLSAAEIDAYVASGDPMDKAGAYGIQGPGSALVAAIEGDFYTVMGFPLGLFVRTLGACGMVFA